MHTDIHEWRSQCWHIWRNNCSPCPKTHRICMKHLGAKVTADRDGSLATIDFLHFTDAKSDTVGLSSASNMLYADKHCTLIYRILVRGDTTMEGPKVPSEARRREAPRKFSKNQRWNCTFSFVFSNVWRVTPVAKQSSLCNSGAKFFFNPWRGGDIHPCPPSGYAPDNCTVYTAKWRHLYDQPSSISWLYRAVAKLRNSAVGAFSVAARRSGTHIGPTDWVSLSRYYWTVDNANLLRFARKSYL